MSDTRTYRERVEHNNWKPRNVVWELTLACNLRCGHCGSSAGKPREHEMDTARGLSVAAELADLGAELVTLSGGEPTLMPGWEAIASTLSARSVRVNMVTNGVYGSTARGHEIARRAAAAGLCNVGLSIDGPEAVHEQIRGKGTFAATRNAIAAFLAAGLKVGVLTTVNRLNFEHLETVRSIARDSGATLWRLQLAKPMGNLRMNDDWVIPPSYMLRLVPELARLKKMGGIALGVGDSIGYYGPHDKTLRGWGWRQRSECWQGCQAGLQALGIESDGGIKGCLSLQAKWGDSDPFVEGNLRSDPLADLWYRPGIFAFNREAAASALTGFCAGCKYKALCRGGAKCVSSAFTAALGEDPYCYYRLATLSHQSGNIGAARVAASAAAAVALSVGVLSCDLGSKGSDDKDTVAQDVVGADACCLAEYGIQDITAPDTAKPDVVTPPDVKDTAAPELCCQPEYGIQDITAPDTAKPDAIDCKDVCCECDYGILPQEVIDACCKPADVVTQPDTAAPDVVADVPAPDAIDCKDVCCECDYGILPQEVIDACCKPADVVTQPDTAAPDVVADVPAGDAIDCTKVCCQCEYGIIPEDVYKKCCEPDPCANACCECDYGEPPPPECCPK